MVSAHAGWCSLVPGLQKALSVSCSVWLDGTESPSQTAGALVFQLPHQRLLEMTNDVSSQLVALR